MHLQRSYNNLEPFPFSKFHLLRTCNRLVLPGTAIDSCYGLVKDPKYDAKETEEFHKDSSKSPILDVLESSLTSVNSAEEIDLNDINKTSFLSTDIDLMNGTSIVPTNGLGASSLPPLKHTSLPLPGFEYISSGDNNVRMTAPEFPDFPLIVNRAVFPGGFLNRRQRGEKRPIPDEQKDDKYYERRKRNNEAAKKSRDARKIREDRIAFRAALLEQENSLLRTQVVALRDELQAIRQLMASSTSPALMNLVM